MAIAEVAALLKFAPRQLEALEQDKFDRLPGPTIARGMVRNYARLLKLEPEPLLERLGDRLQPNDAARLADRFQQPVPFHDNARRSTLIYVGLSMGVLAVVAGVMYEWRAERAVPEFVAPVARVAPPPLPAQTASLVPVPTAPAPTSPAPMAPAPMASAPTAPVPAAPVAEDKPVEPIIEKKAAPGATARIVLSCEEESWIEVKDGAGRLLASSLNPAGTKRIIEGRPPFDLTIGNAQHVRVSYNDRQIDLQPHIKVEVARLSLK